VEDKYAFIDVAQICLYLAIKNIVISLARNVYRDRSLII